MIYIFLIGIILCGIGEYFDRENRAAHKAQMERSQWVVGQPAPWPEVRVLPHQGEGADCANGPAKDSIVLNYGTNTTSIIPEPERYIRDPESDPWYRYRVSQIEKITSGPVGQPREYRKP